MTPNSSSSSYITPEDFLILHDYRLFAQLIKDDNVMATEAETLASPKLAAALLGASGEVEVELVASQRYSVSDLQATNGASKQYLISIIADIAAYNLFGRRDGPGPPELVTMKYAEAREKLEKLRNGQVVLAFTQAEQAGVVTNEYMSKPELSELNLFSRSCQRSLGDRNAFRRGY